MLAGLVTEAIGIAIFVVGLLVARDGVPAIRGVAAGVADPADVCSLWALSWILAATGVFVRDLGQVIGFLLTLWFFLTPICYEERTDSAGMDQLGAGVQSDSGTGARVSGGVVGECVAVEWPGWLDAMGGDPRRWRFWAMRGFTGCEDVCGCYLRSAVGQEWGCASPGA